MYRVEFWWAGHRIKPPVEVPSFEAVADIVSQAQRDLRAGEIKLNSVGMSFSPDCLCVDVIKEGKLCQEYNLKP